MKYRPGNPCELVGEGYGKHVLVESLLLHALSQRAKPYFTQLLGLKRMERAPCTNKVRRYRLPRRLMPPRMVRSPVEICFGTSPSQAAKSRPLIKAEPSPIAATIALAISGPTPGVSIRRLQSSSCLVSISSTFGGALNASIEQAPVFDETLDDMQKQWRKFVKALRQNGGQNLA